MPMTDRQIYNWRKAQNALDGVNLLLRANTESLCEGVPFLTPDERAQLRKTSFLCDDIAKSLLSGERSKPDSRMVIIADGTIQRHERDPSIKLDEDSIERISRILEADAKKAPLKQELTQ
jgi:hypothetical protein